MKKIISISLTFLLLAALLHLSVATHYCGGKVASSKISLSGKLASCGMEDDENGLPQTDSHFASHCCDNVLIFFGITNNYFPSFSFVPESFQLQYQTFSIPAGLTIHPQASLKSEYTSISPPDVSVSNKVDITSICVFRI